MTSSQNGLSGPDTCSPRGAAKTSLPSHSRCNSAYADRPTAYCQTAFAFPFWSTPSLLGLGVVRP